MNEPIAIVGMATLFPGSQTLSQYWDDIVAARDRITDVPDDHSWHPRDYHSDDRKKADHTWATRGGFLDKVPFDPMEWGIPPNALESVDTSQLLALLVARECLRDAGLDPDIAEWDRSRTGVLLGVTGTQEMAVTAASRLHGPEWRAALNRHGIQGELADSIVDDIGKHFPTWTEQTFPGLLGNVVSGRICNRFDLQGPNAAVDAACASSLAALDFAVSHLQSGRADLMISGGSDTINDIFMHMCFTRTPALSGKGDSTPFDVGSDGILLGEGIAMMALKRLSDAEAAGDRIYAVLKGMGASSDGRSKSIYAPDSGGQAKAIRRAYDEAGFGVDTVELIEAHGTGTKVGDVVEYNGLKAVFDESGRSDTWCAVGSVKSQIGHTKSTAGAAGLVKTILALYHRVLPPTAKLDAPNPKLDMSGGLYFNTIARPWIRSSSHPRRAGVSAFGFGGSNFHAVLEEYGSDRNVVPLGSAEGELFLFGASDAAGLSTQLDALAEGPTFQHTARSAQLAWQPSAHVLGFVATDADDLASKLTAARALLKSGPGTQGDVTYGIPTEDTRRTAVLFPGQGSQHVDMGRTVALRHATVRSAFDDADTHFEAAGRTPLSQVVFPPPAFDEATRAAQKEAITATEWAQPAIGTLSKGLFDLLTRFGLVPEAVAGHSYGELTALYAAGVLDTESFLTLSRVRGEAMKSDGGDRGTMAAVSGPLDAIQAVLDGLTEGLGSKVVLANRNHPTQGVISGSEAGVMAALDALTAAGLSGRRIAVSAAFHSPLVADAAKPLADALGQLALGTPSIPVYANVTAAPYPGDAASTGDLLTQQITSTVDFTGILQALYDSGVRTFVECGPKRILAGLVSKTLGSDVQIVSLDDGHTDGDVMLKSALVSLAAAGLPIDLAPLLAERLPVIPPQPGSKATLWIGGANVRFPSTQNPPKPSKTLQDFLPKAPQAAPQRAQTSQRPAPATPVARSSTPVAQAHVAPAATPKTPARTQEPTMAQIDGNTLAQLLATTRQSLDAFQRTQEKTAEVHQTFLEAHAKATDSFKELFQAHSRLVELAAGGAAVPMPAPMPVAQPAPVAAAARAPQQAAVPVSTLEAVGLAGYAPTSVSAKLDDLRSGFHSHDPTGGMSRGNVVPLPSSNLPPLIDAGGYKIGQDIPGTGTSRAKAPIAAAPVAAASVATVDVQAAVFAAVAEKTGYPLDMLELDMGLEDDLGIDSIKRVEVMSVVQESITGLPELDNDVLAQLQTLRAVVDHVQSLLPAPTAMATALPAVSAPQASVDVQGAVFAAVAEKTGYPLDMLELDMGLEDDLGIDSIKRVEVMSVVQESITGLPELDNDVLAQLQTLRAVIDHVQSLLPTAPTSTPIAAPKAVVAAPVASASSADVQAAVFTAVAEKTGYPLDMLELDMGLEDDLGIDSIKRVEVMSVVQESITGLPELDNDVLAQLQTLRAVVDHVKGLLPGAPLAPEPVAALPKVQTGAVAVSQSLPSFGSLADAAPAPERREVNTIEAPPGHRRSLRRGFLALTQDLSGIADALAAVLTEAGHDVRVVSPDWTSPDAVAAAVRDSVAVVHLAAIGASGADLSARVRGAFLAAKAGPFDLFVTVSDQGGGFSATATDDRSEIAALAGLTKTLAHEWDGAALALDVDPNNLDVQALADELFLDRGTLEVGLKGSTASTLVTELKPVGPSTNAPISAGDLVVVSGGARGVTSEVVRELARRWQPTLLLLGRSALPDADPSWATGIAEAGLLTAAVRHLASQGGKPSPKEAKKLVAAVTGAREVRATLADVRATGALVHYASVDVRDADGLSAAIATIGMPVRGLIHGAGVIADKLVLDKPVDAFDWVYNVKVDGLRALLAACPVSDLRFVGMFSSVAGRYGNRGQCDYSMANEVLTRTAHDLSRAGVHAVSFDWGPWAGGMVDPGLKAQFEAQGVPLIELEPGARAFCDELAADGPVEIVIGGPKNGGNLLADGGSEVHTLSANMGRFLTDHRIDGKAVLPAVMVLEWMARAAQRVRPELFFAGLRDFAVLKGVTVDPNAELTLSWTPTEATSTAAYAFELTSAGKRMPTVHYRGTVDLSAEEALAETFPGSNGLGGQPYPLPVAQAYQERLFHGESLRGIKSITGMSDHGIVGTLGTSKPKSMDVQGEHWATDPLVLDSTLQLMVLWVRETTGKSALPCGLGRYRQLRPYNGDVQAHLSFAPTKTARGTFDVTLVDSSGQVVGVMEGAEYTANAGMNGVFVGR